jgi:arsenate reductase (thioredoxin)
VSRIPDVLFVCVHTAGRSQMAAALLERYAQGRVSIRSAGSQPADSLDPTVVAAMHEVGVDLTGQLPKALTGGMVAEADVVITMGCGDSCPVVPGKCYEDWNLRDPAGRSVDEVRAIRDEIDARVRQLLGDLLG